MQQAAAVSLQLPHHLDQRHAIDTTRQVVEQLRRVCVIQRRQFLKFANSDGEDVVEDRFVHAREQHVEQVLPLPAAVGGQHDDPPQRAFAAVRHAALDDKLAAVVLHAEQAARFAAVDRGQVQFAAFRREPIQHGAEELHQRRLAGFVLAEEQRHAVGELVDRQLIPHAEAIDSNIGDLHAGPPSVSAWGE